MNATPDHLMTGNHKIGASIGLNAGARLRELVSSALGAVRHGLGQLRNTVDSVRYRAFRMGIPELGQGVGDRLEIPVALGRGACRMGRNHARKGQPGRLDSRQTISRDFVRDQNL